MNDEKLDILVFGAHADDVELCCGGTVIRATQSGRRVGIVDLTRGEMGTRGDAETRQKESLASAGVLGVTVRERLDLGDGRLATDESAETEVIRIIRRHRPEVVIAPYPDDRHPDHTRTGRLVTDAWFYAGLVKRETDEPAHRPDAVIYYLQNYVHHPTFVVDITEQWDDRLRAIRCYESQFHDPTSNEPETFISKKSFLDMIEARARHYGALIGRDFGEGFVTKQPPMINDVVTAYSGREIR
ncbi:MAG: bacillithiol biosynthesis deacetylase BshB1 [Thermoanaerobaculia bacterium]|nr:bacillithiol biosynthesis deacetylase BshB1 [Thermoanaerobaculia bacterium]